MASNITSTSTPLRIGKVTLIVRDLDKVSDFYRRVIGLELIDHSDGHIHLGAGATVFLELIGDRNAPQSSRSDAGLFHTAFLFPERVDLGAWLNHAAQQQIRLQGASDHRVSEALYLADPENNGIELYVDRPSKDWPHKDGMVAMTTDHLDLDDLVAQASTVSWKGAPEKTVVGHVHLQVGDTQAADAFYADALGLEIAARYPGASFYGSGGYHHHLAGNIWNSRNATFRPDGATGLREVELRPADAHIYAATEARLRAANPAIEAKAEGLRVRDPWNTSLLLSKTEA